MRVRAPRDWVVLGNTPATEVAAGEWTLRRDGAAVDVPGRPRRRAVPRGPQRARRHPARPERARLDRAPARRRRRGDLHGHGAELRRVPPAVRCALPVRGLPPGLRPGVQRRGDGERGLCDVPGSDDLPEPGAAHAARRPGQHDRARDGAHVVRRPRDAGVVGRPVAQRVVRRVHGRAGHRRRHRVHRGLGDRGPHAAALGAGGGPAAEHPPRRRQRRRRRCDRAAELRRHLLRQGRHDHQAAPRPARRRGVLPRRQRSLREAPVRQRDDGRPPRLLGARGRG